MQALAAVQAPAAGAGSNGRRAARVAAGSASAVLLVVVTTVVMLGQTVKLPSRTTLVALMPGDDQRANDVAVSLLEKSAGLSDEQIDAHIGGWLHAVLQHSSDARTQMLALPPSSMFPTQHRGGFGASLADAGGMSALCRKKQTLVDKFDELLRKLGVNVGKANHTMEKVTQEYKDAMKAWLDAESAYRLALEKTKEASQGASFATDEYEKWSQAHKQALQSLETLLKDHTLERAQLLNEKEVMKEIMRLIGVLHDVKASDKSIAAGGRDSVKAAETGVSDPYNIKISETKAQLTSKILLLKSLVHSSALSTHTQKVAALDSKLAVYSETEQVAKILKDMLHDLDVRVQVIDEMDTKAKKVVNDSFDKMVEWEKRMVSLADEAEKSKASTVSTESARETLQATKRMETQDYTTEKAKFDMTTSPFTREIYIIQLIKSKIIEHCEKEAADAAAAVSR